MNGEDQGPGRRARRARPGTAQKLMVGAVLMIAVLAASTADPRLLLAVVAVGVGIASLDLATDLHESGLAATPVFYAVGALSFPVAAYLWHEPGVAAAAAAVILAVAARFVVSRPPRGTVLSVAATVLSTLFVAYGAAYLILLRHEPRGARLLAGLFVIVVVSAIVRWAGDTFLGRRSVASHLDGVPTPPGVVGGLVGGVVGSLGFFLLLHDHVRATRVVAVGVAVSAGLLVSSLAWGLLRPDPSSKSGERSELPGSVLSVVQAIGLAAPALFYVVRIVVR